MGKFKDYSEVADPLILPIGGNEYTIPPVTAQDGIRFQLATSGAEGAEPIGDDEFTRIFLGDTADQMYADNVPAEAIARAAMTAMTDHTRGRQMAEIMWETAGDPKALSDYVVRMAPNRAARRATRSQSTGAARTTRRRASTSGTKPPQA